MIRSAIAAAAALLAVPFAAAPVPSDAKKTTWPTFGGSPGRNMVNLTDRDVPSKFDPKTDCLWKADLGDRCYTQPVVAGGVVLVGTTNKRPRNPRDTTVDQNRQVEGVNLGVLMCFSQRSGTFLWQAVFDKLPAGVGESNWSRDAVVSTPAVVSDRAYVVSNRGTVVCLDLAGFADGSQGTRTETYTDPTDADVIWEYDMVRELKVFPHNGHGPTSSPLVVGDAVFVVTGNGVDEGHFNIPSPEAPSFIALDRHTGKLLWQDRSPGKDIMHGQWASPAYAAAPVPQVIFPGGDGWLRAFDPPTGKLLWKLDGNPKGSVYELAGTGTKSDFMAAPVVADGRLYIGTGQDPEQTDGIGRLLCVDVTKAVENGAKRADRTYRPISWCGRRSRRMGRRRRSPRPTPARPWHGSTAV